MASFQSTNSCEVLSLGLVGQCVQATGNWKDQSPSNSTQDFREQLCLRNHPIICRKTNPVYSTASDASSSCGKQTPAKNRR